MAVPGFLFGGDTGLSQEQLAQRRRVLEAMVARGVGAPKNVGEGLTALGNAIAFRMQKNGLAKGEAENNERRSSVMSTLLGGGTAATGEAAATAPYTTATAGTQSADIGDLTGNDVYSGFMDTVKAGGVENPYALAAIAATGKAESGFDPGNVNRTWSDPSESGKPGRAGGIMSWRGPRYEALQATGDLTPQGQAKFFLQEDPNLIQSLNGAKSVEEAQSMMNRAWAFAGYDRPGGEAARRMSLASSFLPKFQGNQAPQEVASLDPSIGMPPASAAQAIEAQAPQGAGNLSDEVADWKQTPEAQAQFPGRQAVAAAMQEKGMGPPAAQPSPAVQQVAGAMGAQLAPMPAPVEIAPQPPVAPPQQVAQAPMPPQVQQPSGPSLQQLYQAASDPSLNDNDRAVINSMIQQRQQQDQNAQQQQTWMQRQQYEQQAQRADPLYQQKLRAGQLEMDSFQTPQQQEEAWRARQDYEQKLRLSDPSTQLDTRYKTAQINALENPIEKPTDDIREFEFARQQGFAGTFSDWQLQNRKAGAASTTINTGEGSKFYGKLDEKNAETFSALSDGGMQARGRMAQIDRLEGLMSNAPQGAVGALKQAAGEWGIATDGLSDIQAASALLEKMVPEQRAPGSGPMSDADIKMFRASLPRVINQPGGNQLVFQTMRGITQYEMQMGEIADKVANREITPAEGRTQIKSLQNPLAEFKIPEGTTPNEGWKEISPGVRVRKVN